MNESINQLILLNDVKAFIEYAQDQLDLRYIHSFTDSQSINQSR